MPFLLGILVAALVVLLSYAMLRPRSRGFYGLVLIFSSLNHLLLATGQAGWGSIVIEIGLSGLFIALSIVLVRVSSPPLSWSILAGGLFFHAGLDIISSWYAAFCSTLNGALGLWILFIIL